MLFRGIAVAVLLPALVAGVLFSAGTSQASAPARSCGTALSVGPYEVQVARGRVSCAKAESVAEKAFKSFEARLKLGGHGTFLGFRCLFVQTATLDFFVPEGPALFCKSWQAGPRPNRMLQPRRSSLLLARPPDRPVQPG